MGFFSNIAKKPTVDCFCKSKYEDKIILVLNSSSPFPNIILKS